MESSVDQIVNSAVNEVTGNSIILTTEVDIILNALFLQLCNDSIAYKRTNNGIRYSNGNQKSISVYKITMSTWGIHIDKNTHTLFIHNADTIHPRILQRLTTNQPCHIVLTYKHQDVIPPS